MKAPAVSPAKTWHWQVPGLAEALPDAGAHVAEACRIAGLDPTACQHAMFCTVEALNNALTHAHRGAASLYIDLHVEAVDDQLVIEVVDRGSGDWRPAQEPPPPSADPGGRGWFIISSWMDEASYGRGADGNVLTMVKYLSV